MADAEPAAAAHAAAGESSGTLFGMLSTFVGTTNAQTPAAGSSAQGAGTPSKDAASAAPKPPTSEVCWRQLLTRLRHDDAAPVRTFLQSRLRQFSMQSIDELPERGAGSVQDLVQKLQRDALQRMQKCEPWGELDEAGWEQTAEAVERFVSSQLHDVCLGRRSSDRAADEALTARCDALATFLRPENLHVPVSATEPRFADAWASAQDFLHRMAAYKDPWRKLLCIDRCCRQLYRVLHVAAAQDRAARSARQAEEEAGPDTPSVPDTPSGEPVPTSAGSSGPSTGASGPSADDLVPCVIWSILRSNPPRLRSHLAFIERFRPSARMRGSLAYHLTVLQSAVHFLEGCSAGQLGLDEESFAASLAAGEERAASRGSLARQLQSVGDGDVAAEDAGAAAAAPAPEARGLPPLGLAVSGPAPAAHELPLCPPLPELTPAALAAWKAQRYRFAGRDPASLTVGEVPELLAEYRNLIASCSKIAEALGLPPPDVKALSRGHEEDDAAAEAAEGAAGEAAGEGPAGEREA